MRLKTTAGLRMEAITATRQTLEKSDLSSSGSSPGMDVEWNLMETNGDEMKRRSTARVVVGFWPKRIVRTRV